MNRVKHLRVTQSERRYYGGVVPRDDGLRLFKQHENGEIHHPETITHPTFLRLMAGKLGHDYAREELRQGYFAGDDRWPGLDYLRRTTTRDELMALIPWHRSMRGAQ